MPDPIEEQEDETDPSALGLSEEQTSQLANGAAKAAPAGQGGQNGGVLQVKHGDFKRIKDEQRAKGRREAIDELDAKARAVGFESHDDALKALAALKKPAPPVVTTPIQGAHMPPKTSKNDPAADKARADAIRAQEDRVAERKKWRQENRKNRELEAALQAKDAEMALREECYRAGVKDVDYMIRLLTRELQDKSQEEIAAYDRTKFYEAQKKERPYLFGEVVVAATTGTGGETKQGDQVQTGQGAPATPAPGAAAVGESEKKKFDAKTAKPEEVQQRLRELGLNPHL